MPGSGTTTVNFGASPGTSDALMVVTGQASIAAGSLVEAWLWPLDTADHSVDEHRVEEIVITADTVIAGTGFTIFARTRNQPLTGLWSVAWVWK